MKPFKFLTLTTTIITYFLNANSQSPVITPEELLHMPLEELIKIEITSVSKRSESIFETPLSSNVITAEEIIRSGVTTIPEAIRLIPGVIVREQTNGVYDVHIRGFDYLNVGTYSNTVNTITLVMIDGRP
ncbi:MAG TPA: Plug domain-containing protein, partial [Salinivirgaceae bacterium]|nr:Plug domain-containing protein [Salinivirgaceae bacterium]